MSTPSFPDYADCFKALSDDFRIKILCYLYENGEQCVCSLCEIFEINQSGLSYHLKILLDSGLLIKRKNAVWNIYSLNRDHFLFPVLDKLFAARKKKMRRLPDPGKNGPSSK